MASRLPLSTGLLLLIIGVLAQVGTTFAAQYACTKLEDRKQPQEPLLQVFNRWRQMVGSPDLEWDYELTAKRTEAQARVQKEGCGGLGLTAPGQVVWGCEGKAECQNLVDRSEGQCLSLQRDWGLDDLQGFKFTSTMYTDNKHNPNAVVLAQILWAGAKKVACMFYPYTGINGLGGDDKCFVVICNFDTPSVPTDEAWGQNIRALGQKQADKLDTCAGLKQVIPGMCTSEDYQYQQRPLYSWCATTCGTKAEASTR